MIRRVFEYLLFGTLIAVGVLWASVSFEQGTSPFGNTWYTPGNQQVGGSMMMCLNAANAAIPCAQIASGSIGGLPVGVQSQYPNNAVPITASATGTTAATTATLAASASGRVTYICGFSINSTATAAAAGNATVTGTITGTLNYEMGTGVSPAVVITTQAFNPCVPGSAVNTAVSVVSAAPGTGGVISVTATGYQL